MEIILFALATIGFSNIIVHGKILDTIGLRPLLKKYLPSNVYQLFECYECTGFWTGMFTGMALISNNPFVFIPCGFAGSVLSSFYMDFLLYIQSKTDFVLNDEKSDENLNKEGSNEESAT